MKPFTTFSKFALAVLAISSLSLVACDKEDDDKGSSTGNVTASMQSSGGGSKSFSSVADTNNTYYSSGGGLNLSNLPQIPGQGGGGQNPATTITARVSATEVLSLTLNKAIDSLAAGQSYSILAVDIPNPITTSNATQLQSLAGSSLATYQDADGTIASIQPTSAGPVNGTITISSLTDGKLTGTFSCVLNPVTKPASQLGSFPVIGDLDALWAGFTWPLRETGVSYTITDGKFTNVPRKN